MAGEGVGRGPAEVSRSNPPRYHVAVDGRESAGRS
jgi:hypothetical protein